jgi:Cu2+-exporting ATPase
MASTTTCAHCGLPCAAGPEGAPAFCCRGCRTVWELVHEAGLDGYYALRERLEPDAPPGRARAERAAEVPAFAHLDDPTVLAQLRVDDRPGTAELHLTGMHCPACVWLIERLPLSVAGLRSARVDFGSGRLQLEWDPERVSLSHIAALLHRAGYEVHEVDAKAQEARRGDRRRELVRLAVTGASAGNVMLVSFALYSGSLFGMELEWSRFFELAALVLALPALSYGALPFYRAAWAGLRAGSLHIDLPIALGLLGGFAASVVATFTGRGEVYFDSLSLLVLLLLVGRHIQRRGQQWALSQTDLMQLLLPARARRITADGTREDCSARALAPGERVEVRPSERIPADAVVLRGRGSVDASSLSGESKPISVEVGDTVLAGTRLLDGSCELEVRAVGADTRIGSLAAKITQAARSRAPIQRAVDRISSYFVAGVLGLALCGGLAWWFIAPERVFFVVVSLLVISCPCALGLATPVALAVARARAARRGILVASAGALEALAKVETVVFDKTGTLSEGALEVRAASLADDLDEAEIAALILAVERDSGHPVAQALRRWAEARTGSRVLATNALADLPGKGRKAYVTLTRGRPARRVRIGSLTWLEHRACFDGPLAAALARGDTPVLVEIDHHPAALLSLADTLRPEATAALARLRAQGLKLAIRSGDHPAVVTALAHELGIEDAAGAMSPEDKAHSLTNLGLAAMVGDGVNDAPALRAAKVGVAVRGSAEIALRSADVHLAEPGLHEVAELFEGARRTMAVIHRNLGFSAIYNLVFASLALAGLVGPLAAALLMPASSLTVVLSSVLAPSFGGRQTRRSPLQSLHPQTTVLAGESP